MSEIAVIYNITDDFPNGISITNLKTEIQASAIINTYSYTTIVGSANEVRIFFIGSLSGGDQIILDNIVLNHNPIEPDQEEVGTIVTNNIISDGINPINLEDFLFQNNTLAVTGETASILLHRRNFKTPTCILKNIYVVTS